MKLSDRNYPAELLHFAVGLLIMLYLPGCSLFEDRDSLEESNYQLNYKKWQHKKVADYTIVINRQCYCPASYFPAKVVVRNDTVSQVFDADTNNPVPEDSLGSVELRYADIYPTIDQLFNLVNEAINREVNRLHVRYNNEYGYPKDVYIDYDANIADEEIGYTVSAYRPAFAAY